MTSPATLGPDTMVRLEAASWTEMASMLQQMRNAGALPPRGMPSGARYVVSDDPPDPRAVVLVPLRSFTPASRQTVH